MSNTEKDKDVSCFTVDGVVAEMVIEVEENQKIGSDDSKDLSSSPSKDDKKNEDTNDAAVEKQEESENIVLNDENEDKKNSSENMEVQSSSEVPTDNDKSQDINDNIVVDEMCEKIDQSTEESKEITDPSIEHNSGEMTQHTIINNQRLKRKSKHESDSKQEDSPRYPGRKRLANKRYISEEMITPKRKISESVDFKDVSKEEKKRKIEVDFQEKEEVKDISDNLSTKKSDESENQDINKTEESNTSKEIGVASISRPLRKRKSDVEGEKSASKQNVLRKLPLRKNKDAPDIPDLKPKVFWLNGVGEGQGVRLGDIPEIKERIQKAKSIRALYRVLFFQWPTNGQDLIEQILDFNGFPFDKSSYEFAKRQSIMKIMLDKTIFHMCELLDIRKGDKNSNIKNILEFLLRPSARIDPAQDLSWQPVVVLEKIELDDTCFEQPSSNSKLRRGRSGNSSKNIKEKDMSSLITPTRSTRSSSSRKIEIVLSSGNEKTPEKSKQEAKSNKTKLFTPKESKHSEGKSTINENIVLKDVKVTISPLEKKMSSTPVMKDTKTKDTKMKNTKMKDAKTIDTKIKDTKIIDTKIIDTKVKDTKMKDTKMKDSKTIDAKNKNTKVKDSKTVDTKAKDIKKKDPKTPDTKAKLSSVVQEEKSKTTITANSLKEKTMSTKKEIKAPPTEEKSKSEEIKSNISDKQKKPGFKKTKKKFNSKHNKKVPVKSEVPNVNLKEDSDEYEIEMTIDSGPDIDDVMEVENVNTKKAVLSSIETAEQSNKSKVIETPKAKLPTVTVSDSSETESAEETKLITASKKATKIPMKRRGKPLRQFPKISDSIQTANFSALQRLHILLFGASDKAENLKSNILSFGGFPFLEGSDEWKQKHFLLSLLAQNNLREYLNLLCIPYASDDQPTMINKLMRFLAVPTEESLDIRESNIHPIETEVVSSVLVNKSSPISTKSKGEIKKKVKKKEEKKVSKRPRKVLMSEEEARRLEANFAREQRALARDKKMPVYRPILQKTNESANTPSLNMHTYVPQPKSSLKPPAADPEQLNALIQTVYKRRALKAAGAVISTPNKGVTTKLGDLENVKFLIVTANLSDLEILHRLIFMLEASKSRIRKNIMDFEGFGFNEDSPKYKHRMDYLKSLGYEASKRISFLLGLCPLNTNLPQQDLNELIMYFLMSPCRTKQTVPITQMPTDERHIIVKSTQSLESPIHIQNASRVSSLSVSKGPEISKTDINIDHSTPLPKTGSQKARKTFPSSSKISPVKKILLPPSQSPVSSLPSLGNKRTLLNTIPAVPTYSMPKSSTIPNPATNVTLLNPGGILLNSPKSPVNSLVKVPVVNTGSKVHFLNQSQNVAVIDPVAAKIPVSLSNVPGQILPNQILIPQISNQNSIQPSQVQTSMLQGSKMVLNSPTAIQSPQEFIVQQQTPDGQQKTFKLIRLPPNHPLVSNAGNKVPIQQTVSSPQQLLLTNAPLSGTLPPGLVIMKNSLPQGQNLQVLQNAPVKFLSLSAAGSPVSPVISSIPSQITSQQAKEIVSSGEKESLSASANTSLDNSMEIISSSSEDNPPTDEDLFSSIQEIILSSNFEDITLRNVIERVAAQYPNHDLTSRHNYMKECVKKIIIGT